MYLGEIVEMGTCDQIFNEPKHPYTKALLASIPIANPQNAENKKKGYNHRRFAKNPPKGCHFYSRCPVKMKQCKEVYPEVKILPNQQQIACHLF